MNFEKLLAEKKIEKVEKTEYDDAFALKDIEFARQGFKTENYEWVMTILYNAVFRVCNNLMNQWGYRTIGKEHHKNIFEFMFETKFEPELVKYFDSIRKRRNNFLYRDVSNVSEEEIAIMIKKTEEFVQKIRTFVQKIRT